MERKKVAILLPWLKMGGTNKIAINFMKELIQYCDVTLILSQKCGELLPELPDDIRVIVDEISRFPELLLTDLKHFRIRNILNDIKYYATIKLGYDSVDNYKYIVKRNSYISDLEFDCAINYHGQSPEQMLNLIYRIHSKKKVAWIHGEMSFPPKKIECLKKYYAQMDHFFFVSHQTQRSFDKTIGVDSSKATVYYNPIDKKNILARAEEPIDVPFPLETCNILTVGRLSLEKGQDMIPEIVRRLLDKGYNVCWYIIGDGDTRIKIEQLIQKYKVEKQVKLLGIKTNPYCYIKQCDIYVQPSYTEGYSTTICEAGILGKAIIGTKTSGGIREQLTDGVNGLIVDTSIEGLIKGIEELINCPNLRMQFEETILKENFSGNGEIKKFLRYLNNG